MQTKGKKLYRLYIDESGDHRYGKLEDTSKRYLSLTGCVIEREVYERAFCITMEQLKKKHFIYDLDEPIIFHREDIVKKHGSFYRLRDPVKEAVFNTDLLNFMKVMQYRIITVVIDKRTHIQRHGSTAYHPYHYCLTLILKRYCGLLSFLNAKGDVLAESRGGRENEELKDAYRTLYDGGSKWMAMSRFQNALTSREIKLKRKEANIAGLQLADLLAHPLKEDVLVRYCRIPEPKDFGAKIRQAVVTKLNRRFGDGKIDGYGRIFLK